MKAQVPAPKQPEQRLTLNVRVPAGLIARLEAYRRKQPVLPSLTETVCHLLDRGMGTKP